jgi:drug/metabolite transporter (DMT)-like permease
MKTSIVAGILAATGSAIGKLAFDGSSSAVEIASSFCLSKIEQGTTLDAVTCDRIVFLFRSALAVCMVLMNGVMLGFYVRAMQEEGSLPATVTNFGASFVMTGLIGYFIFSESLNVYWCFGATLISIGVYLVAHAAPNALPPSEEANALPPSEEEVCKDDVKIKSN